MRNKKLGPTIALASIVAVLLFALFGIALAADPTAQASRTIDPKVVERGDEIEVTVVFQNLLNMTKAFSLLENIPTGWEFTRGTDDAITFRGGDGTAPPEWVWFGVGAGATKTVTYNLTVPVDAEAGNYTINGTVTSSKPDTVNPVGGDTTITVEVLYNLTMAAAPGIGGTATDLTNASPYAEGTAVSINATAAAGYRFVNWTAPAGVFGNATAPQTIFTMPAQNVTATTHFVAVYTLIISSTAGGNVTTPGVGTFTYDTGTVVNLVASPDAGYRFVNWTGDVGTIANVNAASTNITMNGAYSITANFVAIYGLTISSTPGGNVTTPGEGTFTYDAGTVVNLVATPSVAYRFVNWTAPAGLFGNVTAAETTFTMPAQNVTVTANFEDLMDYYRGLHEPSDKVDTLDLLAAADDWIADVVPPGFKEPITTDQLLQLADYWIKGL
jgi:Divergent InlB B-repeat domain